MCHKEWKMGRMVGRIQHVGPSNLLNNMVHILTNTGNTLPPTNLRTPFAPLSARGVCFMQRKSKQ